MTELTPGPTDVWALDSNAYSPDKFYTKSTDGRGNSELIQVKVSPFVYGVIAELVESPDFPDYKTKADLIRDALIHLLRNRRDMMKDGAKMAALRARTEMLMAEARVERLKNELIQEQRFTEALIEAMELGVNAGNVGVTGHAIDQAEAALDQLPFHLADRLRKEVSVRSRQYAEMQARAAIEYRELERHA